MTKVLVAAVALLATGCTSALYWVAMPFVYREAELPDGRVIRDVPYRTGPGADPDKHRLDLFLPAPGPEDFPFLLFVHGGGWTRGDRGLRAGGRDVYGNIGRYFAARGIGAAVISYRLQPEFEWTDQVADVAAALAWVREHAAGYGGDPDAIFLAGHSAGAQLAAWVGMDPQTAGDVCGIVAVSGAAYDLADEETYALGASPRYYERRFRDGDASDGWRRDASLVRFARPDLPPTLVLYAEDDYPSLRHQARLLEAALEVAGARSELLEVPGVDHSRIVLALSREDRSAAPAVEGFIRRNGCASSSASSCAGDEAPCAG